MQPAPPLCRCRYVEDEASASSDEGAGYSEDDGEGADDLDGFIASDGATPSTGPGGSHASGRGGSENGVSPADMRAIYHRSLITPPSRDPMAGRGFKAGFRVADLVRRRCQPVYQPSQVSTDADTQEDSQRAGMAPGIDLVSSSDDERHGNDNGGGRQGRRYGHSPGDDMESDLNSFVVSDETEECSGSGASVADTHDDVCAACGCDGAWDGWGRYLCIAWM